MTRAADSWPTMRIRSAPFTFKSSCARRIAPGLQTTVAQVCGSTRRGPARGPRRELTLKYCRQRPRRKHANPDVAVLKDAAESRSPARIAEAMLERLITPSQSTASGCSSRELRTRFDRLAPLIRRVDRDRRAGFSGGLETIAAFPRRSRSLCCSAKQSRDAGSGQAAPGLIR